MKSDDLMFPLFFSLRFTLRPFSLSFPSFLLSYFPFSSRLCSVAVLAIYFIRWGPSQSVRLFYKVRKLEILVATVGEDSTLLYFFAMFLHAHRIRETWKEAAVLLLLRSKCNNVLLLEHKTFVYDSVSVYYKGSCIASLNIYLGGKYGKVRIRAPQITLSITSFLRNCLNHQAITNVAIGEGKGRWRRERKEGKESCTHKFNQRLNERLMSHGTFAEYRAMLMFCRN